MCEEDLGETGKLKVFIQYTIMYSTMHVTKTTQQNNDGIGNV